MLRLSPAALGAALALTAACAKERDQSGAADSAAATVAAAPTVSDSSASRTTVPAGAESASVVPTPPAAAATNPAGRGADSVRKAPATAPATRPAAAAARSTAPVSAPAAAAPRSPTGAAAAVTRGTGPVTAAAPQPAVKAPAAPAPATAAPAPRDTAAQATKVNRFMTYDASAKTVSLEIIAAFNSQRGGFNFNGGSDGAHVITVPQGWTVRMHVRNVDAIPHSAIIILDQKPLPNAPETPAISRAYTSHVSDGLPAQTGQDDVEFRASKAGNFLIFCGVPGHGPSGMYIRFVVSADAAAPSYSM